MLHEQRHQYADVLHCGIHVASDPRHIGGEDLFDFTAGETTGDVGFYAIAIRQRMPHLRRD